jgi:ABC-type transporter Mla subunit MlaD
MARIDPRARTSEAIANKAARAERLIERLETLAESAAREADQIQAALGALKHLAPDANTTHRDDISRLSDAELDAEIARREGELSALAEGAGPPDDPPVAH